MLLFEPTHHLLRMPIEYLHVKLSIRATKSGSATAFANASSSRVMTDSGVPFGAAIMKRVGFTYW